MAEEPTHIETTPEHFETFKAACLRWRERLGLHQWQLYFKHGADPGMFAQAVFQGDCTAATIRLAVEWSSLRPLTDEELDRCALHEMLHLMTGELNWAAS